MPEIVDDEVTATTQPVATSAPTDTTKSLSDEVAPVKDSEATETTAPEPTPAEPTLPAKYEGKTIAQVVEMHQNAEAMAGRQSQEVGELRGIVDDFIKGQSQSTENKTDEEPIDILDDPQGAVAQIIESHPDILAARETVKKGNASTALNALIVKHPDTKEILGDPRFKDWVGKSAYRSSTFRSAHEDSNVEAADELFTEFKAQHPVETTPGDSTSDAQQVTDQAQAVKQASTGAIVSAAGDSKKVYRRADLIKLKVENPDRYEALEDEIFLAYQEKRVI